MKKYLLLLALGPLSNALWAFWALPQIGEQGYLGETVEWVVVQALLPVLFAVLLRRKKKYTYWLLVLYSMYLLLYAIGILGWGLIGAATPFSIYCVAALMLMMGFGLMYQSLKDLGLGKKEKYYDLENE